MTSLAQLIPRARLSLRLNFCRIAAVPLVPAEPLVPISGLDGCSDLGTAVEGKELETIRALHLKAVTNLLRPLSEHHRALGAFYFDLVIDHKFVRRFARGQGKQVTGGTVAEQGKQAVAEIGTVKVLNPTFIE
jgi:hypothetical protein